MKTKQCCFGGVRRMNSEASEPEGKKTALKSGCTAADTSVWFVRQQQAEQAAAQAGLCLLVSFGLCEDASPHWYSVATDDVHPLQGLPASGCAKPTPAWDVFSVTMISFKVCNCSVFLPIYVMWVAHVIFTFSSSGMEHFQGFFMKGSTPHTYSKSHRAAMVVTINKTKWELGFHW